MTEIRIAVDSSLYDVYREIRLGLLRFDCEVRPSSDVFRQDLNEHVIPEVQQKMKGSVIFRKAGAGEGYNGIGKDFLDMENMLVPADDEGSFGSSMSDSVRAMFTEKTKHVLCVIYCFEEDIDLEETVREAAEAFAKYARAENIITEIL